MAVVGGRPIPSGFSGSLYREQKKIDEAVAAERRRCLEHAETVTLHTTAKDARGYIAEKIRSGASTEPAVKDCLPGGEPSAEEMLDYLQSMTDPEKQRANGGFVTQTLEIRDNATLREAIRAAMEERG